MKIIKIKLENFRSYNQETEIQIDDLSVFVGKKLKKPQAYVSKIERGERRVDVVELDELAKLYDKQLGYFV